MPFQYQKRSPETFAARENFRDGGSFDSMFTKDFAKFKPKVGENAIRILPPTWEGAQHYAYDVFVHYNVGDSTPYLSLWKHFGKPDPVHEAFNAASREGDEELERKYRATRRAAFWLIDRSDPDKGPMLWLAPATSIDRDIIQQSRDRQTGEVLSVDDPVNGYDITFTKTGERLATKYSGVAIARRSTPLNHDPAIAERWLEFVVANPIPSLLKFYSYERIASVLKGEALPAGMDEVAPPAAQTGAQTHPVAPPAPPSVSPTNTPPVNMQAANAQFDTDVRF